MRLDSKKVDAENLLANYALAARDGIEFVAETNPSFYFFRTSIFPPNPTSFSRRQSGIGTTLSD